MIKRPIFNIALLSLFLCGVGPVCAQVLASEKKEPPVIKPGAVKVLKRDVALRDISGMVTSISNRFIGVEYTSDAQTGTSEEVLFNISKNLQFQRMNSLADIRQGDRVRVYYQEELVTLSNGRQERKLTATIISFVKKGAPVTGASVKTPVEDPVATDILLSK